MVRVKLEKIGVRHTKLYNTWRGMKERCCNPNHKNYNLYKDKLCDEWKDSKEFFEWALKNGYEQGLSIDRIDPKLGYTPSNCQWLTKSENIIKGNKGRKLTQVEFKGSLYTKKELAIKLGVKYTTLIWRLDNNKKLDK